MISRDMALAILFCYTMALIAVFMLALLPQQVSEYLIGKKLIILEINL